MSLVNRYIIANKQYKQHAAVVYRQDNSYKEIDTQEMYNYVGALAAHLNAKYEGKTIAVIGRNSLEYVISLLTVIGSVGDVLLVDNEIVQEDIENIFAQVRPELIILDDCHKANFQGYEVIRFSEISKIMRQPFTGELKDRVGGKIYLHTSGTTGMPKCIELDENRYFGTIPELNKKWGVVWQHSCLFIIPLFHVYALISMLHSLYAGTTIIVEYEYSMLEKVLKETHPSLFMGVPLMYNKIRNAVLESNGAKVRLGIAISNALRKIGIDIRKKIFRPIHNYFGGEYVFGCSAGSLLSYEVNKFFDDVGLPIYNIYGMTEASGAIAMNYNNHNRYDSVGEILDINEVNIMNQDEKGIGEIWVKGPNVIDGYVGEEKEEHFNKGFFSTGDIGYIKEGYLYVVGRKKNILIGDNGKNVSPEELRSKLLKNKGIDNCNIVMENNYLKAVINTSLSEEQVAAIVEDVNSKLPKHKQLSGFTISEKIIK